MASFEVPTFNEMSQCAQALAGVDPSACIALVEHPTDSITKMPVYFGNLAVGKYVIPEAGEWREHDITYHVDRVRSLHPDMASLIAEAADFGGGLLRKEEVRDAKLVNYRIDDLLSGDTGFWSDAVFSIMNYLGRTRVAGNARERIDLLVLQDNHARAIRYALEALEPALPTS